MPATLDVFVNRSARTLCLTSSVRAEDGVLGVSGLPVLAQTGAVLVVNISELRLCSVAPESYEELRSVLSGRSMEEQLLVVERIQKCSHPSLAVGNKERLEVRRSEEELHTRSGSIPSRSTRVAGVTHEECLPP